MEVNILNTIIEHKRLEVEERRSLFPTRLLERSIYFQTPGVSMREYLLRDGTSGIIAEIKRRSPSKGVINPNVSVERTSIGYMQAGASALSILTDTKFFGGTNEDLLVARKFNFCPILRKDFILDEYQLIEAKSIGADVVLLIAAMLESVALKSLCKAAHSLGLEVLMEVHSDQEFLEYADCGMDIVGVNNRDLNTFEVSLGTSRRLSELIPRSVLTISESGISTTAQIVELKNLGYRGFLMGEAFMCNSRPERAAREFITELQQLESLKP